MNERHKELKWNAFHNYARDIDIYLQAYALVLW